MDVFNLFAIIITLAVVIGYLNYRFVKMQTTIAIMMGSFIMSFALLVAKYFGWTNLGGYFDHILKNIHFDQLLLKGMLSFLLFAGSIVLDVKYVKKYIWEIFSLATISTICSYFLVSIFMYYIISFLGIDLNFLYCLLFGALISPTDPIAILATFKSLKISKISNILVAGESLFNDGVGIVLFIVTTKLVAGAVAINPFSVFLLFIQEAGGGIFYGLVLGYLTYLLIKPINDSKMAILITLGTVTGGYAFANYLNISGPLAMVVAGLFLSNHGEKFKIKIIER